MVVRSTADLDGNAAWRVVSQTCRVVHTWHRMGGEGGLNHDATDVLLTSNLLAMAPRPLLTAAAAAAAASAAF